VRPLDSGVSLRGLLELELAIDYDFQLRFLDCAAQPVEFVGADRGVVADNTDLRPLARLGLDAIRVGDAPALDDLIDAALERISTSESEHSGQSIGRENPEAIRAIVGTGVEHILDPKIVQRLPPANGGRGRHDVRAGALRELHG
jgi:hypothetical protein